MHCDAAHIALSEGKRSLALVRHVMTCSACRAYQRGLARINRTAQTLDCLSQDKPTLLYAVLGTLLVALVGGVGLLVTRRLATPRSSTSAGAGNAALAAVGRADTWHYSGWRKVNQKRLKWEVWGRRQPFFYREQLGEHVLYDNGKVQIRQVPRSEHCPKSYSITMPSRSLSPHKKQTQLRFSNVIETEALQDMARQETNPKSPTYTLTQRVRYYLRTDYFVEVSVARQSHLPTRYTRTERLHAPLFEQVMPDDTPVSSTELAAELDCQYNIALPKSVQVPPQDGELKLEGALTLSPSVRGQDTQGNLLVHVPVAIGKTQIKWTTLPWLDESTSIEKTYSKDNLGRHYIPLEPPLFCSDSDSHLWLAPVEPLRAEDPRGTSVTFTLNTTLLLRGSYLNNDTRIRPLESVSITVTLPLPQELRALPYDNFPVPKGWERMLPAPTFAFNAAVARFHYYNNQLHGIKGINALSNPTAAARAQFWIEAAITEAKRTPNGGALERRAQYYREAR